MFVAPEKIDKPKAPMVFAEASKELALWPSYMRALMKIDKPKEPMVFREASKDLALWPSYLRPPP
jgi:hypothetical protein